MIEFQFMFICSIIITIIYNTFGESISEFIAFVDF